MAIGIDEWTPALEAELGKRRETYNILQEDRLRESMVSSQEYPVADPESISRSRAKKGKKGRKP